MPSDTPIYRDGRRVFVSRRAYERVYKRKGWRLTPPRNRTPVGKEGPERWGPQVDSTISPPTVGGDQTGDTPDEPEKE